MWSDYNGLRSCQNAGINELKSCYETQFGIDFIDVCYTTLAQNKATGLT